MSRCRAVHEGVRVVGVRTWLRARVCDAPMRLWGACVRVGGACRACVWARRVLARVGSCAPGGTGLPAKRMSQRKTKPPTHQLGEWAGGGTLVRGYGRACPSYHPRASCAPPWTCVGGCVGAHDACAWAGVHEWGWVGGRVALPSRCTLRACARSEGGRGRRGRAREASGRVVCPCVGARSGRRVVPVRSCAC